MVNFFSQKREFVTEYSLCIYKNYKKKLEKILHKKNHLCTYYCSSRQLEIWRDFLKAQGRQQNMSSKDSEQKTQTKIIYLNDFLKERTHVGFLVCIQLCMRLEFIRHWKKKSKSVTQLWRWPKNNIFLW